MRRGQLLSLDALMATVVIIMLLSAVSATSDNLKSGIANLINWYDRTSVPSSMLDVLLNSPGKPANWSDNVSLLRVPGLRSSTGQYVDYDKLVDFIKLLNDNDTRVVGFMKNLSLNRPFLLAFYMGTWKFSLNFSWTSGNTVPPGYTVYNGSCVVSGSTPIDSPTVIDCSGSFSSSGSTAFNLNAPLCVYSRIFSSGSLVFQPVTPASQAYLALSGGIESSGSQTIYTNLYLKAPFTINVSGSLSIQPVSGNGYVVVYGGTSSGALNIKGAGTVDISGANLYVQVDNRWYASNETGKWYLWTGSSWVPTTIPPGVNIGPSTLTMTVEGYKLPEEWVPPSPPACFNSGASLNITSISTKYTSPAQLNLTDAWAGVASLGGSKIIATTNISKILEEMKNATQISYSERHVVVGVLKYDRVITVAGNRTEMILAGTVKYPLPRYSLLNITVPNETGYVLMVAVSGSGIRVLGVWKPSPTSPVRAEIWTIENGTRIAGSYAGNANSVSIPWMKIFGNLEVGNPVMLYVYSNGFTEPVNLIDTGNIGMALGPIYQSLIVKLWMWG